LDLYCEQCGEYLCRLVMENGQPMALNNENMEGDPYVYASGKMEIGVCGNCLKETRKSANSDLCDALNDQIDDTLMPFEARFVELSEEILNEDISNRDASNKISELWKDIDRALSKLDEAIPEEDE